MYDTGGHSSGLASAGRTAFGGNWHIRIVTSDGSPIYITTWWHAGVDSPRDGSG